MESRKERISLTRKQADLRRDLQRRVLFLRSMLEHPRRVGAVWPTSRWAVRDLLEMSDLSRARTVVEFGAGTGVYTGEILRRLHPDSRLLSFEIDGDLAAAVAARLTDSRLDVIHDSVTRLGAYLEASGRRADVIVSSLPFTTFTPQLRNEILDTARDALTPGGVFLVLQYSTSVVPDLELRFSTIRRHISPINLPPAFLFACESPRTPGRAT